MVDAEQVRAQDDATDRCNDESAPAGRRVVDEDVPYDAKQHAQFKRHADEYNQERRDVDKSDRDVVGIAAHEEVQQKPRGRHQKHQGATDPAPYRTRSSSTNTNAAVDDAKKPRM
ncbi:hypothetical protein [Pseudoclavibacter helvolus]|uniref:hypothetical protein n=1 Tax=Pseudoclavibacter helvolus TaxID=255205 RepID=UPI003C76594C